MIRICARRLFRDPMDLLTLYCLTQKNDDVPPDERWLAAGERARVAGFRFAKRRNDWLLGRWTAKQALHAFLIRSGQDAPDYPDLEIRSSPDGAPEAHYSHGPAPVSLALSHSGGQGFCVIASAGIALGCDLEIVQFREPVFIEDYFGDEEKARIADAPLEKQLLLATLIWSAKESALKCLRAGLRRDTRSVLATIDEGGEPDWNSLTVRCQESSHAFYGWWRSAGEYVQTVAAEQPAQKPIELCV